MDAFRTKFFTGPFRCRYHGCSDKTGEAFQSAAEREKHELTHLPRFQCLKSHCVWKGIGFRKRREIEAHMLHYHPDILDKSIPQLPGALSAVGAPESEALVDQATNAHLSLALEELKIEDLPDHLKQTGVDWHAVFNPNIPRSLDVGLLYEIDHKAKISCATLSSDGELLAVGTAFLTTLYGSVLGNEITDFRISHISDQVCSLCFSPTDKFLVAGSIDEFILIWDLSNITTRSRWKAHDFRINGLSLAPNGRFIVSYSTYGMSGNVVKIWDVRTTGLIKALREDSMVRGIAISPGSEFVAIATMDTIVLRRTSSGDIIRRLGGDDLLAQVNTIDFSPTVRYLLTACVDGTVKIRDISSMSVLLTLQGHTVGEAHLRNL